MSLEPERDLHLTRRQLFGLSARGIGIGALASLIAPEGAAGGAGRAAGPQSEDRRPDRVSTSCATREAGDLPAPVRRAVPARDIRLQAWTRAVPGHADPRFDPQGSTRRPDDGAVAAAGGEIDLRVRPTRGGRDLGERAAAAHREDRRRHHRHQDDVYGCDQSRSRDHVHPDRLSAAGPAEHGLVDELWAGDREQQPAVVRGPAVAGAGAHRRPAAVLATVGERVPALELPGREVPRRRRAGAVSQRSAGRGRARSTCRSRAT